MSYMEQRMQEQIEGSLHNDGKNHAKPFDIEKLARELYPGFTDNNEIKRIAFIECYHKLKDLGKINE